MKPAKQSCSVKFEKPHQTHFAIILRKPCANRIRSFYVFFFRFSTIVGYTVSSAEQLVNEDMPIIMPEFNNSQIETNKFAINALFSFPGCLVCHHSPQQAATLSRQLPQQL